MLNLFKQFREVVNIFLYDSKDYVAAVMRPLTFIASIVTFLLIIFYYGFSHEQETRMLLFDLIKTGFFIFALNYFSRFIYSLHKTDFLKHTWLEGIFISLIVLDGLNLMLFNRPLLGRFFLAIGIHDYRPVYIIIIQVYLLILIGLEFIKVSRSILSIKIKPGAMFIGSYLILIAIGAGLLMMPEMTVHDGRMPLVDALFTSVSAACITGLIVVDTATYFTFKGHFVILILMQLGGIGIISFASFFAFFLKRGVGIQHQTAIRDFLSEESLFNTRLLLRQIIVFTFGIELIGFVMIYSLWDEAVIFASTGEKIFYTLFHAVSSFCNAGFALFSDGLMEEGLRVSYVMHIVFAIMIMAGSLGFPALRDLFSLRGLRERMRKPWKEWKTSTSIAVYSAIAFTIIGAVVFYLLEKNNTLEGQGTVATISHSFFQSITTRSAGFSTLDISTLTLPTFVFFVFLMFIGGSSGGTGGGIKTSTFFIIALGIASTIRGEKRLTFQKRTISYELLNRAYSILMFTSVCILTGVFILTITDPHCGIMEITFDMVSAFCTVGLSTGIMPTLSDAGKIIICLSMIAGRVGILTVAFALSSPAKSTAYKYPDTHMMVG